MGAFLSSPPTLRALSRGALTLALVGLALMSAAVLPGHSARAAARATLTAARAGTPAAASAAATTADYSPRKLVIGYAAHPARASAARAGSAPAEAPTVRTAW